MWLDLHLTSDAKIHSKWIHYLNLRTKAITLLEEKWENLNKFGLLNFILKYDTKSTSDKRKLLAPHIH
jgi:hypothetical protein